jgi:predicted PurR-regulated permease PerM
VGDIVQSIYDYVDVAWKTALAGGTILLLMQLILQTVQLFDHWCLFSLLLIALALFLLNWFFPGHKKLNRIFKECLLFISVLTMTLYIILPVSIAGAAFLSKQITRPLVEEARQGFESLQHDLAPQALNERFFPESEKEDSLWSRLDFNAKLNNCKAAIMEMAKYLEEITQEFAMWTIKIIAGYLFDCIVFPMAFFIAVYILAKNLLTYAIGIRRDYTIREDFEAVLARYYGK